MDQNDQYDFLMNIGSSKEGFLLVASPLIMLCVIAIIFLIVTLTKRRNEAEALEALMIDLDSEESSLQKEAQSETSKQESLVSEVKSLNRDGWLSKLKSGLGKTSSSLQDGLSSIFTGKSTINEDTLEQLHETLYRADIGVAASDRLVDHVRKTLKKDEIADWNKIKTALRDEVLDILTAPQKPIIAPQSGPQVIMIVGVNGVGKTTTIGKLAAHYLAEDKTVLLCAADTYRAAAIEQLKVWGERVGVDVIAHQQGSDPAATAFDAVKAAVARKIDVLLVDTAGRLHNKSDLMDELSKVCRIMKREIPEAPHETWLVIDSTTGQNATIQTKAFKEVANLSGLVVTKLDGTAKGGVIIGIAEQSAVPVRYIGVGEQVSDLREFSPADFANTLFDLS